MATKLCEYSIDDLRAMLRATELSAGTNSTSAKIIRRELMRKLEQANISAQKSDSSNARRAFK
jgi:hypothetical protein